MHTFLSKGKVVTALEASDKNRRKSCYLKAKAMYGNPVLGIDLFFRIARI